MPDLAALLVPRRVDGRMCDEGAGERGRRETWYQVAEDAAPRCGHFLRSKSYSLSSCMSSRFGPVLVQRTIRQEPHSQRGARAGRTGVPAIGQRAWIAATLSLVIAGAALIQSESTFLMPNLVIQVSLSLWLCWLAGRDLLSHGVMGKLLLVCGVLYFFWLEAFVALFDPVPFEVPPMFKFAAGRFDDGLVIKALFYVSLFQFCLLCGYALRPRVQKLGGWLSRFQDREGPSVRWLEVLFGLCAFVPVLAMTGFNPANALQLLLSSRSDAGIEVEDVGLLQYVSYFGMFGAGMALLRAFQQRMPGRAWSLVLGLLAFVPILLSGTRHLLLYPALPIGVYAFLRYRGQFTPRRLLGGAVVLLVIFFAIRAQLAFRTTGWDDFQGELNEEQREALFSGKSTLQFESLLVALVLVPDHLDYFHEPTTPFFFTHFIPRAWYPEKPYMQSYDAYTRAYTGDSQTWNATPSVIGQFHINWGILGVIFIGVWMGLLAAVLDRLSLQLDLRRQRGLAVMLGFLYAFVASSFRIYHPLYMGYPLFGAVALWASTRRRAGAPGSAARGGTSSLADGAT